MISSLDDEESSTLLLGASGSSLVDADSGDKNEKENNENNDERPHHEDDDEDEDEDEDDEDTVSINIVNIDVSGGDEETLETLETAITIVDDDDDGEGNELEDLVDVVGEAVLRAQSTIITRREREKEDVILEPVVKLPTSITLKDSEDEQEEERRYGTRKEGKITSKDNRMPKSGVMSEHRNRNDVQKHQKRKKRIRYDDNAKKHDGDDDDDDADDADDDDLDRVIESANASEEIIKAQLEDLRTLEQERKIFRRSESSCAIIGSTFEAKLNASDERLEDIKHGVHKVNNKVNTMLKNVERLDRYVAVAESEVSKGSIKKGDSDENSPGQEEATKLAKMKNTVLAQKNNLKSTKARIEQLEGEKKELSRQVEEKDQALQKAKAEAMKQRSQFRLLEQKHIQELNKMAEGITSVAQQSHHDSTQLKRHVTRSLGDVLARQDRIERQALQAPGSLRYTVNDLRERKVKTALLVYRHWDRGIARMHFKAWARLLIHQKEQLLRDTSRPHQGQLIHPYPSTGPHNMSINNNVPVYGFTSAPQTEQPSDIHDSSNNYSDDVIAPHMPDQCPPQAYEYGPPSHYNVVASHSHTDAGAFYHHMESFESYDQAHVAPSKNHPAIRKSDDSGYSSALNDHPEIAPDGGPMYDVVAGITEECMIPNDNISLGPEKNRNFLSGQAPIYPTSEQPSVAADEHVMSWEQPPPDIPTSCEKPLLVPLRFCGDPEDGTTAPAIDESTSTPVPQKREPTTSTFAPLFHSSSSSSSRAVMETTNVMELPSHQQLPQGGNNMGVYGAGIKREEGWSVMRSRPQQNIHSLPGSWSTHEHQSRWSTHGGLPYAGDRNMAPVVEDFPPPAFLPLPLQVALRSSHSSHPGTAPPVPPCGNTVPASDPDPDPEPYTVGSNAPSWNPGAFAWGNAEASIHDLSAPPPLDLIHGLPSWDNAAPASEPSMQNTQPASHSSRTSTTVPPLLKPWGERTAPPMSSAFRALCVSAPPMHVALPSPTRRKKEEDNTRCNMKHDVAGYSQYGEKKISSEEGPCRGPPLTKAAGGSLVATVIGLNGVPMDGHPPLQQPQDLHRCSKLDRVESPNARHEACFFPEPILSARLLEHERNQLFAAHRAAEKTASTGMRAIPPPFPPSGDDYDYDTEGLHTGHDEEDEAFSSKPSYLLDSHKKDELNLKNERQQEDRRSNLEDLRQRIHDELELRAKRKQAFEEEKKRACVENASSRRDDDDGSKQERWNLSSLLRDLRRGRTDSPPSRTPRGTRTVSKKEPRDTPTKASYSSSSSSQAPIQALGLEEGAVAHQASNPIQASGLEAGAEPAEGEASSLSPASHRSVSSSKDPSSSAAAAGPSSPRRIRSIAAQDTMTRSERRKKSGHTQQLMGINSSSGGTDTRPPSGGSFPHPKNHPPPSQYSGGDGLMLPRSFSSDGLLDIRRRHPPPMDPTLSIKQHPEWVQSSIGAGHATTTTTTNFSCAPLPLPAPYPPYVATMNRPIVGLTPREVNRGAGPNAGGPGPHYLQVHAPAAPATSSSEQFTVVTPFSPPITGASTTTPSLGICAGLEWERWDAESMRGGMRQHQLRVNRGSDNVQFSLPRASTPPARIFSADARPGIEHRRSMLVPRTSEEDV